MNFKEINNEIGAVDLFLLDEILKGRYAGSSSILDAGCGEGRNLVYFLKNNYRVMGIDNNPTAIALANRLARQLGAEERALFQTASLEDLPFPDESVDHIICCSVLHFSGDESHFFLQFDELFRTLRRGGSLFIRMAGDFAYGQSREEWQNTAGATFFLDRQLLNAILTRPAVRQDGELRLYTVGNKTSGIINLLKK